MNWADFAAAAPELAAFGLEGFGEQNLCLLGTIRTDGWPRISPCEVYLVDDQLMLGMMPGSTKVRDLMRDPRITVMTPQCDREARHGDVKLYGRVVEVTDPDARERYGQTIFAAIGWRPDEPYPLYAVDIEAAGYVSFGERRQLLRWTPIPGVERLRHPDG
jgi:hypothetical protein